MLLNWPCFFLKKRLVVIYSDLKYYTSLITTSKYDLLQANESADVFKSTFSFFIWRSKLLNYSDT